MNPAAVSSILQESSIVSTKILPGNIWHKNIVYGVEDRCVYMPVIYGYLQSLLLPGSHFVIKHSREYLEYLFEGTVTNIKPGPPSYLEIGINKVEELINVRAFPRYDVYLSAQLRPQWEDSQFFCIVNNISSTGLSFYSKQHFDYGEECQILISLPYGKIFASNGKIVRKYAKGSHIEYGMQFIDPDYSSITCLNEFFQSLESDSEKMKSEFIINVKPSIIF